MESESEAISKGVSGKGVIFIATAVLVVLLIAPFERPVHGELWSRLSDAFHLPLFVVFTVVVYSFLPRRSAWTTVAVSLAACIILEGLQPLTGRTSSLVDLLNGMIGIALGIGGIFAWRSERRILTGSAHFLVSGLFFLLMLNPAWHEWQALRFRAENFPMLGDFEQDGDLRSWRATAGREELVRLALSTEHGTRGTGSLRVQTRRGSWAGITFANEGLNWTGKERLVFHLFNPGGEFTLRIRIDDRDSDDRFTSRFNRHLAVQPGANEFVIPVEEITGGPRGRTLKLAEIRQVMLFTGENESGRVIYLDHMHLE